MSSPCLSSRPRYLTLRLSLVLALGLPLASPVQADTLHHLQISAQPLGQALNELARQTGLQLLLAPELVAGKSAAALSGRLSSSDALRQLLAGSGLEAIEQGNLILIRRHGSSKPELSGLLPEVQVSANAERAYGPVNGYRATRSATASKLDTPLIKTAQAVSVIGAEQMADQDVQSVAQALRYTSGVFTEYRGASNLHDEMYVRGFAYAPRYLNGLQFGSGSLGQLDPYLLERVELLRGPASILYGQANPGGIVNLVAKLPQAEPLQEVQIGTGNRQRRAAAADLGGQLDTQGKLLYRVVLSAERMDLQEAGLKQQRLALAPALSWQASPQTRLDLHGFVQIEPDAGFRNFMEAAGTLTPTRFGFIPRDFLVGDPSYDRSERDQFGLGYRLEHALNDQLSLRQNLRVNTVRSDYRTLIWNALQADQETISRMASGGSEDMQQLLADHQLQYDFQSGSAAHRLLAGLDLQHSVRDYQWGQNRNSTPSINWRNPQYGLSDIALNPTGDTKTRARQYGLYLQDQLSLQQLTLSAGLRHDWARTRIDDHLAEKRSSFSDRASTGRLGAIYNFANGAAPYLSYSTSFEPVLEAAAPARPFVPSKARQLELGFKFAPEQAGYQFSVAAYDLRQRNVLYYDFASQRSYQTGEVGSRGIELEAQADLNNHLKLSAAYSHIKAKVRQSVQGDIIGKAPSRIPKQQASLWAKYENPQGRLAGLGIAAGVRHIGTSQGDAQNSFEVAGATLLDLALSYDFSQLGYRGARLQLNANNLSDKRYVASCASKYACFYGNGRVLSANLKQVW